MEKYPFPLWHFSIGRMAIDLYLDRRTFRSDYPTVCHNPKAGPIGRTISHANIARISLRSAIILMQGQSTVPSATQILINQSQSKRLWY